MKTRALIIALALLGLSACDQSSVDQCMRREIFTQCMANQPKGTEAVEACDSSAYYQSKRRAEYIKPECRP